MAAFNTTGSTTTNPKKPFGDTSSGLFGKISSGLGFSNPAPQAPAGANMSTNTGSAVGQNKGFLSQFGTGNKDVKQITTKPDGSTIVGLYSDNQKKTARGGTSATPASASAPTSTVKAPNDPSNKYDTSTGQLNPSYVDPNAPKTPQVGTTKENAQTVLETGQFTPFEKQKIGEIEAAKGMQNYGQLAQNAESPFYAGANPNTPEGATQLQGLINRPDLVGRAGGSAGLYGALGNIYGSASQAGLSSAQAQANRAQSAATTVLGASLPGQISGSARTYNPLDAAGTTGAGGIVTGANNEAIFALQGQNNKLKADFEGFDTNLNLAKNLASQSGVSDTSVPFLNELEKKLGTAFASSPAVAAFRMIETQLKDDYGITLPENASINALNAAIQVAKAKQQNIIAGNQTQIDQLSKAGTTSGGSTGGNTGGTPTTTNTPW